jgi:hypothetical protein
MTSLTELATRPRRLLGHGRHIQRVLRHHLGPAVGHRGRLITGR